MSMDKKELLEKIFQQTGELLCDEETKDLLLGKKVNPLFINQKPTLVERITDLIARIAGSWFFIIGFALMWVLWIFINMRMKQNAVDPYPFILLNLILSCLSAFQAPLIMMSQNRQDQKDRNQAKEDYITNLKSKIMIEEIYEQLQELGKNQKEILEKLKFIENNLQKK